MFILNFIQIIVLFVCLLASSFFFFFFFEKSRFRSIEVCRSTIGKSSIFCTQGNCTSDTLDSISPPTLTLSNYGMISDNAKLFSCGLNHSHKFVPFPASASVRKKPFTKTCSTHLFR